VNDETKAIDNIVGRGYSNIPLLERRSNMRMLMQARIPHKEFNAAVKDGSVGEKIKRILEDTKPQTVSPFVLMSNNLQRLLVYHKLGCQEGLNSLQ
jgi:hypothetical protein